MTRMWEMSMSIESLRDKILKIITFFIDLFGLINIVVFFIPGMVSIGVWIGSYLAALMWLALLAEYVAVIFLSIFVVATIIRQRKIILTLRQRQQIMEQKMKQLFGVSCPNCGNWIDADFPSYVMSGMHPVDGPPTGGFWRNTEEREVICKKCGKHFHIDIPRSQTFKIRENP